LDDCKASVGEFLHFTSSSAKEQEQEEARQEERSQSKGQNEGCKRKEKVNKSIFFFFFFFFMVAKCGQSHQTKGAVQAESDSSAQTHPATLLEHPHETALDQAAKRLAKPGLVFSETQLFFLLFLEPQQQFEWEPRHRREPVPFQAKRKKREETAFF
jgi:hypothetical protein